ncbi:hypothetical protein D3C84_1048620 [compost metagenome]
MMLAGITSCTLRLTAQNSASLSKSAASHCAAKAKKKITSKRQNRPKPSLSKAVSSEGASRPPWLAVSITVCRYLQATQNSASQSSFQPGMNRLAKARATANSNGPCWKP